MSQMISIISTFFVGICLGLSQSLIDTMDMDKRVLLNIYHLETSSNCPGNSGLYDFERSVIKAINYVRSLVPAGNKTRFLANIHDTRIPGCFIQEEDRSLLLVKYLKDIKSEASHNDGYSVFIGPPHQCDCNLVNAWISGGSPEETRHQQLYQISYFCPLIGHNTVFNIHLADSTSSQLTTPISAVAIAPSNTNILRGLGAYLITKGWRNIAIFYEPLSYKHGNLVDLMRSIPIPLITTKLKQWALMIHQNQPIYFGMNFTRLLSKFEDNLDAVIIMANPSLAVEFLIGAQNVRCVKEGSIAIIQTNPTDMFTYDSLRNWRAVLSVAPPTLSAGRSLIILNVLPFGTLYDDNSYIYQERINIAVANAAAVAMRLVQINLEAGDGNLIPAMGLFNALKYRKLFYVPTVPNITFTYKIDKDINMEGIYEMLFFALTPKVTERTLASTSSSDFKEIFYQIDVLKYPQIHPWKLADMKWPGDGKGPSIHRCLAAPCDFFSMRFTWANLNHFNLYLSVLSINPSNFKEDPVCIKQLGVPRFPLHSKTIEYLGRLRELRHLNINTFVGCCLIADKFSFVYDFCQRGSLQLFDRNLLDKLWMAPELLRDCANAHKATRAGDVYSFAIILHQVLHQCEPYGRNDTPVEEIIARVASKESPPLRPEINCDEFSPDFLSILERCMCENPDRRPSFKYLNDEFQRMQSKRWDTFLGLIYLTCRKVNVVEHMIQQLEKCSSHLEKQVAERKKELESENKKQSILISRMLPPISVFLLLLLLCPT
ncbi:unnamed protein product [Rodentolepis nana]|uniref:guanylate cyclase n=1 Tax=Rodentolepis nana TaxID=102285 RepID=A0A0R3TB05_RODNA|nr:unnamed protein product [Rodentolepis nana]